MQENPLVKSQAIFASSHSSDQGLNQQEPLLLPLFKTDWEMRNCLEPTTLGVYVWSGNSTEFPVQFKSVFEW